MSNKRIVNFAYFSFAIIVGYVLSSLLAQVWAQLQWQNQRFFGQIGIPEAIAIVLAIALWVILPRYRDVTPFLLEVVAELREVTWPTRQEVASHTRVVIVTVLVMSAILGVFDIIWSKVSKFLLNPNI